MKNLILSIFLFLFSILSFPFTATTVQAFEDPSFGLKNAPVTLEVFDDLQCPFCNRFHKTITSSEITKLMQDGKLRLVFKDFPLAFHSNAKKAAQAANSVYEINRNKFMDMTQKLFENQNNWGSGNPDKLFISYAKALDINSREFLKDYESEANIQEINQDITEGSERGVSGTPSFFVNGTRYSGAQPLTTVLNAIDKALKTLNEKNQQPKAGYENEILTAPTITSPFSDTTPSLAESAAVSLYQAGILGGFPDGTFRGKRLVNRAEAAKFLILANSINLSKKQLNNPFRDVISSEWYGPFVLRAAEFKIINGYSDGNFRPAQNIQRDEFLAMMSRSFGLQRGLSHSFSDKLENANAWYWEYAGIAKKYNLFPGSSRLNPQKKMTREEFAIALYQYLINR